MKTFITSGIIAVSILQSTVLVTAEPSAAPVKVPNLTATSDAAVCAALKSSNALVRGAAAREVGNRKLASCQASVRQLLEDPLPTVRLDAADVLLQLGDKSGLRVLRELLKEGNQSTALRAAGVLAREGDPTGLALAQSKLSDPSPIKRWQAMVTLSLAADKKVALGALTIGLHDPDRNVRVASIARLGARGDAEGVNLLRPVAISDPFSDMRRLAVRALGASTMNDALPVLMDCLADSDSEVRALAAVWLADLTRVNPSGIKPGAAVKADSAAEIANAWRAWWQRNKAAYPVGARIPGLVHGAKPILLM